MLGKLTVAKRLALGFGALVALLAMIAYLGMSRLAALNEMTDHLVNKDWQKAALANDSMNLMNTIARETLLLPHLTDRKPVLQRIDGYRQKITAKIDLLDGLLYKPEGKVLLAEIREKRKVYIAAYSNVATMLESGKTSEASELLASDVVPALNELLAAVNRLVEFQGKILEETGRNAAIIYADGQTKIMWGLLISALLGIALAVWIVRSVTVPLGGEPDDAKQVVECIAGGDLSAVFSVKAGDDSSLLAAMRGMQSNLQNTVAELKRNTEGVTSASQQLSASSSQVAIATSSQSEAASSMAAAVQEMTVSINHVSDLAREAHAITVNTDSLSRDGNRIIQEAASGMQQISQIVGGAASSIQTMGEKSQQISSIVQVIKDVADQTNLLALNAAIEAARAGEQGRGFAVVADEVRKLAERTAKATTEIGAMIDAVQSSALAAVGAMQQAVSQVENGVEMVRRAGDSMADIGGGAQNVLGAVAEISGALKEQSVASNEIAVNVERIAQMSEENSAAANETAETASQLEKLADGTHAILSQFRSRLR